MVTTQDPDATLTPLTLHLFGAFTLEVRGQVAPVLSRAARSLLALLALRASRPVERDLLAVTLWPDSDDNAGRYNLRRTLTELRAALGAEAGRLTSRSGSALALDLFGDAFCDVLAFDYAVAGKISDTKSEDALKTALELYEQSGGVLLEGERGEWVFAEREARAQAYLAARERLAKQAGERGEWQRAVRDLQLILAIDPTRETAVRDLMRALRECGQGARGNTCCLPESAYPTQNRIRHGSRWGDIRALQPIACEIEAPGGSRE